MTGQDPSAVALAAAVNDAREGDRLALERVVTVLQHDIYRLALRMTGCQEDARDASQEILIKVVTRLDAFRGESSVRTWAYRIAVHHLLDRRKSRVERFALTFERFGADLLDGLADPATTEDPQMVEEVKRGCTLAMLMCLDRPHRLAYVLADVFDLAQQDAADLCGVTEGAYRQRLSRARRALESFTKAYCGLLNARAPCRCDRRVARAAALGRIERGRPSLARDVVGRAVHAMEALHDTARLMRASPDYHAPRDLWEGVRLALAGPGKDLLE